MLQKSSLCKPTVLSTVLSTVELASFPGFLASSFAVCKHRGVRPGRFRHVPGHNKSRQMGAPLPCEESRDPSHKICPRNQDHSVR